MDVVNHRILLVLCIYRVFGLSRKQSTCCCNEKMLMGFCDKFDNTALFVTIILMSMFVISGDEPNA